MAETIPPRSLSERYKEKPPEDDHEPEQRKDDVPTVTHHGLVCQTNAIQPRVDPHADAGLTSLSKLRASLTELSGIPPAVRKIIRCAGFNRSRAFVLFFASMA